MFKFYCGRVFSIELVIVFFVIFCRFWNFKNFLWILLLLLIKCMISDNCFLFEILVILLVSIEKYGVLNGIWFIMFFCICFFNILINLFCMVGDVYFVWFVVWLKWLVRILLFVLVLNLSNVKKLFGLFFLLVDFIWFFRVIFCLL